MGVLGLWQLLNPTARTIKIEGLEGKILAIDISIWLHQATKGSNTRNAHIIVLFNRICKLLHFKIKPIFVFDGLEIPALKRTVLKERQKRRQNAKNNTKEIDLKLQKNFLETFALNQFLGGEKSTQDDLEAIKAAKEADKNDDMFKLKDLDEKELEMIYVTNEDDLNDSYSMIECPDIAKMDPEVFNALPIDIKIELLTDYKEKLKRNKAAEFESFPENTEDFSKYQMKMLLKKGGVSKQLNDLKQSIKMSIANDMDIPCSSVIHEKIASEDDREILMISRKNTEKFSTFQTMLEREFGQKKIDQPSTSSQPENLNTQIDTDIILKNLQGKDKDEIILAMTKETEKNEEIKEDEIRENDQEIAEPVFYDHNIEKRSSDPPMSQMSVENSVTNEIKEVNVLKRPCEEDMNKNFDVSGPKLSKYSVEKEIVQIDESDMDEDDFEKVIIPEMEVKIPIISILDEEISNDDDVIEVRNETNDLDNIIIIDEIPTTSQKSISNDTKKLAEVDFLSENPNINLDDYHEYLKTEKNKFLKEKQHESKLSNTVEPYMIEDAKFLLNLFGIPYIMSPSEAEAQCAHLDLLGATEGSITEDSDIWLFGAKNVYKNFFNQNQYIEHYSGSFIESQLGLDRESFINIALLVGCDYTTGVEGVGIVKAMEILNEFEGKGFEKLINFKTWYDNEANGEKLNNLRKSLKKLSLSTHFPSKEVHEAYISPKIDKINQNEKFRWGFPDIDSIRKFLISQLSWDKKKIDDILLPAIKRLNENKIQKTMDNYLLTHDTVLNFSKQSKRMKNAIQSFKSKTTSTVSENDAEDIEIMSTQTTSKSEEIEMLNLSEEDEEYKPQSQKSLINKPKNKSSKKTATKSKTSKKKN